MNRRTASNVLEIIALGLFVSVGWMAGGIWGGLGMLIAWVCLVAGFYLDGGTE